MGLSSRVAFVVFVQGIFTTSVFSVFGSMS